MAAGTSTTFLSSTAMTCPCGSPTTRVVPSPTARSTLLQTARPSSRGRSMVPAPPWDASPLVWLTRTRETAQLAARVISVPQRLALPAVSLSTSTSHTVHVDPQSDADDICSYFKGSCPNSYAYAYDESSGTALFTCPTDQLADFTVTFCP
jgi:hypothetical protein